jgi:hypothetical protein
MTDVYTLPTERLQEMLEQNLELLRQKRQEYHKLEDEVIALCFENDEIRDVIAGRHPKLRLVS